MPRRKREWKITDVHAHILPGVDDGSGGMEESVAMLKMAYEQGVRRIIATPHYHRNQDTERLKKLAAELQKEAEKIDPAYRIYLGQELMDSEELIEDLKEKRALTMGESRYVLIEFLPETPFSHIYQRLRQLQTAGYLPIVAHVERYTCLWEKGRLEELIQSGNCLQMNYSSLRGSMFQKRVRWCRRQVAGGNIHLLGTDMHRMDWRSPEIREPIRWLYRHCSRDRLYWIFKRNPEYILKKKEGMGR